MLQKATTLVGLLGFIFPGACARDRLRLCVIRRTDGDNAMLCVSWSL